MDWFLVFCLLTIFRYTRNWYNINERFFSDFRIATIYDVPIFYEKQKLRFEPPSIMSSPIPTVSVPLERIVRLSSYWGNCGNWPCFSIWSVAS